MGEKERKDFWGFWDGYACYPQLNTQFKATSQPVSHLLFSLSVRSEVFVGFSHEDHFQPNLLLSVWVSEREERKGFVGFCGFGIGCVGVAEWWCWEVLSFLRVGYVLGDGAKRWNWCRVDVSMEWGDEGGALVEEETRDSPNRKLTGASLLFFFFLVILLLLLWWRRPRCQVWGARRVRKGATPPRGRQKPRAQRAVGNAKLSQKPWHWSNSSVKCSLWLTWRKWFSWPRGIAQSPRIFDWLNDWINDSHEAIMWVALDRHQRAFDQLHFSADNFVTELCRAV